jgi:DnaD/phage-associated family protein
MQIDESRKLLLSDTPVPDIFITEHMPALDGLSVKLYIYLLLAARSGKPVTEVDLARRLGVEVDQIRISLQELAGRDIITVKDKGLEIQDIKAAEIEKSYRQKTASTPLEATAAQEKYGLREKLLADIAKTFFQGLMSPSWYGEIDSWFDRYGFEPEVIYALFQECARRNKLESKAYIGKVAENWSLRGIKSFQDLNSYFQSYDRVNRASKKIGKKLRRTMTEYDEEFVARWMEKLGYDFDIIELALRKTTKQSSPNLAYIDKILEEWFSHQLRDAEAIKVYEAAKAARIGAARHTGAGQASSGGTAGGRAGNIGNFSQREYSAEYLDGFYEEVEAGGDAGQQTDGKAQLADEAQASQVDQPGAEQAGSNPAAMPGQIGLDDLAERAGA